MQTRILLILAVLMLPVVAFSQSKRKKEQLYNMYVHRGDSSFGRKNYMFAREQYAKASALKPGEQYPKDRLSTCDVQQAAQDAQYNNLVKKADSCFFKQKNWTCAKDYYMQAVLVNPNQNYAANQAKICNYNISAASVMTKDQQYVRAIAKGDSCYNKQDWNGARENYQHALSLKPLETYPLDRVREIDNKTANPQRESYYNSLIKEGDDFMKEGKYIDARKSYRLALDLKPQEKYPQEKLAEIENLLKQ